MIAAATISKLEAMTGQSASATFDVIAGTSVGGIVALGLASGVEAIKIVDGIERCAGDIFRRRCTFDKLGLFNAKYDSAPLADAISEILGDWAERTLSELPITVLIPAVEIETNRAVVFSNAPRGYCPEARVLDVALATSAAPTYFRPQIVAGKLYADGGLAMNNPDAIAYEHCSTQLSRSDDAIRILSIGTGVNVGGSFDHSADGFGILSWLTKHNLISRIIGLQEQVISETVLKNIGENYFRINVLLEREIALDASGAETLSRIRRLAERHFDQLMEEPQARLSRFLR
jgi:uncharacterized protein